ncbi:MAG: TetR family transcriptional regulator C-terminal domain-containing protein [Paracoccaceae bacterium]|nr:TetR family transcriptional regulator C-terminal domain-containing protein [Paracoccaceae bacterium]MDE2913811.1 TetR family transcriptional regulator C-terminal domain-containing protein [Paracoccaceae bacterium]
MAASRRQQIRRSILDAAIIEFSRNGLEGTSTQAIADRAGLTKPQLHYYISSKEELYDEALQFIVAEWKHIFFMSTESDADPAHVIVSYVTRKIRHAIERPEVARLFAREVARGATALSRHWDDLAASVDQSTAIIQSWIDQGLIRELDPLIFQMNIWAATEYFAEHGAQARYLLGVSDGEALDADRLIRETAELFLARAGLSAPDDRNASAMGTSEGGTSDP